MQIRSKCNPGYSSIWHMNTIIWILSPNQSVLLRMRILSYSCNRLSKVSKYSQPIKNQEPLRPHFSRSAVQLWSLMDVKNPVPSIPASHAPFNLPLPCPRIKYFEHRVHAPFNLPLPCPRTKYFKIWYSCWWIAIAQSRLYKYRQGISPSMYMSLLLRAADPVKKAKDQTSRLPWS